MSALAGFSPSLVVPQGNFAEIADPIEIEHYIMRRSQRRVVVLEAQLRTGSGLRDGGSVLDLSLEGCRLNADTLFLSYGQRLVVRIAGLEGLAGTVRWVRGQRCGIEFAHAIHPAVLEHVITHVRQRAA